jgi:hypothetical protein
MKNSPHKNEHQKHKAIKEANRIIDSGATPDQMIENKDFKKQFNAKEQALPHKESNHHKKTSKRTSPGEVDYQTERSHVHTENEHWMQTVQSQNNEKSKLFQKKQLKRKS